MQVEDGVTLNKQKHFSYMQGKFVPLKTVSNTTPMVDLQ